MKHCQGPTITDVRSLQTELGHLKKRQKQTCVCRKRKQKIPPNNGQLSILLPFFQLPLPNKTEGKRTPKTQTKRKQQSKKDDLGIKSVDMGQFFDVSSCSRVRRHHEKVGRARFKRNKRKWPFTQSLADPWNLLPKDILDDKGLQELVGRQDKYLEQKFTGGY